MEDRIYHIRISPENIKNDIFKIIYNAGTTERIIIEDECCDTTTTIPPQTITASTFVYSSMTQILSGGTGGTSLLTGLTIPFLLTENYVDIGYYSVFDGLALQKDVMLNFLFSATTGSPYTYYFYNTSDTEFKKFLSFSKYEIDWGDGSVKELITTNSPNSQSHIYSQPPLGTQKKYTISMSGMSPWGWNVIKKDVYVPFTGTTIDDPFGEAFFYKLGGNWSATPISYKYIFEGDAECDFAKNSFSSFTKSLPFIITGYTKSSVNDLQVYGDKATLIGGKFKPGVTISGNSGFVGVFNQPPPNNAYTSYTINDINYYDFKDGTTIFVVNSSGLTPSDLECSYITKDEVLLNVIDQPEVQSDIYVERGKNSGLESIQRMGEIDNIGDLEKYGYKFFKIIK